jgi:hypothetical protein
MALVGCDRLEPPLELPQINPLQAAQRAVTEFDKDGDGAIAGPEFASAPGLKAALAMADKDSDGRLTNAEIEARLARYLADEVALTNLSCQVTLDGQPLRGAKVQLVPESFLAPAVKTAEGTTDQSGACTFGIPGEALPGTNCGLFRVEVSKKSPSGVETIPAKYNTQTVFGADIGIGAPVMNDGLILHLKSR